MLFFFRDDESIKENEDRMDQPEHSLPDEQKVSISFYNELFPTRQVTSKVQSHRKYPRTYRTSQKFPRQQATWKSFLARFLKLRIFCFYFGKSHLTLSRKISASRIKWDVLSPGKHRGGLLNIPWMFLQASAKVAEPKILKVSVHFEA